MNRFRAHVCAVVSFGSVLMPGGALAASLTQVNRSDWAGSVKLPSYVQMYIYVPDKLASKPPIMVSSHSCGSTATGQMGNIPTIKAAADKNGFILILPDNPGQNCWDVGSKASLTHDGGGDTQAVAQMVKYALMKYSGDPARVYAMGGSSGGMMTQALMAVYPDLFRAGSARAGVPAGCWSDGYDSGQQWSNNCAGGNTTKTGQQWGDLVRGMYPGYMGHRPRLQIMQGESDTTISYKNTAESVKEWTNVFGLSTEPSSSDKAYKAEHATYDRQFWENSCGYVVFEAWSSPGGTHSMPYEEADILKFFGLDTGAGTDPEPDCNDMGGGMGGASGSGGMTSAAGSGGTSGAGGITAAGGVPAAGGAGMGTAGNAMAMGGAGGSGGATARAGATSQSGSTGGSPVGSSGSPATSSGGTSGGMVGSGATAGTAGSVWNGSMSGNGSAGQPPIVDNPKSSSGCALAVGHLESRQAYYLGFALGLSVLSRRRRRRRSND